MSSRMRRLLLRQSDSTNICAHHKRFYMYSVTAVDGASQFQLNIQHLFNFTYIPVRLLFTRQEDNMLTLFDLLADHQPFISELSPVRNQTFDLLLLRQMSPPLCHEIDINIEIHSQEHRLMLWRKAENCLFGEKNVCPRRVSAEDIHSFTE